MGTLLSPDNGPWYWYPREVRYCGEQAFITFGHSMNGRDEEMLEVTTAEADRLRSHIGKRGVLRFVVDGEGTAGDIQQVESMRRAVMSGASLLTEARAERDAADKRAEKAEDEVERMRAREKSGNEFNSDLYGAITTKRNAEKQTVEDANARAEKAEAELGVSEKARREANERTYSAQGVIRAVREKMADCKEQDELHALRSDGTLHMVWHNALASIAKLVAEDQPEPVCATCEDGGLTKHSPDCTKPEHDPSCECLGTDRGDEHDSDCPAYVKGEPRVGGSRWAVCEMRGEYVVARQEVRHQYRILEDGLVYLRTAHKGTWAAWSFWGIANNFEALEDDPGETCNFVVVESDSVEELSGAE